MSPQKVDYLIVGQGLAGTLLSWFLIRRGQSVLVLDHPSPHAASRVAAGLINPITGRHYVKSWRFDELLPVARSTYGQLEDSLGLRLHEERPILRSLLTAGDENSWWARAEDPAYAPYLVEKPELGRYRGRIREAHAYGEVRRSGRAAIGDLVRAYGERLAGEGRLLRAEIRHEDFQRKGEDWQYRDIRARRVVFCEGYRGKFNPFFSYLPFRGAKGEVILVRIPEAEFGKILKNRIFIVPLGNDTYWIGATMENRFEHEMPTGKGKTWLLDQLNALLTTPYEVIEHRSAIRPTVKDRRPFLGAHPKTEGLYLFNGLGSKGATLGPFFARQMADFLVDGKKLEPEVDIKRFQQYVVT